MTIPTNAATARCCAALCFVSLLGLTGLSACAPLSVDAATPLSTPAPVNPNINMTSSYRLLISFKAPILQNDPALLSQLSVESGGTISFVRSLSPTMGLYQLQFVQDSSPHLLELAIKRLQSSQQVSAVHEDRPLMRK